MRVIIQRSKYSSVSVNQKLINEINHGLVLLVSFTHTDSEIDLDYMVNKIINLRIFNDDAGVMNKSILDCGGEILSISQFTLYADTKKGNRPSYINALGGEEAIILYELFNQKMNQFIKTKPGIFGSMMELYITNDGPVTIILDSSK